MKALVRCAIALGAMCACATPVAADPVQIVGGGLVFQGAHSLDFSPLTLEGTGGFTFQGRTGLGIFEPSSCFSSPCPPGDSLSLGAHWSGPDLGGTATFDGRTYERVGALTGDASLLVNFSGSVPIPSVSSGRVVVTAPFSFAGQFFVQQFPESTTVALAGGGIAAASFILRETGLPGVYLEGLRYEFTDQSTVPEPSTLVLVASGAAVAWKKGRRRKEEGRRKKEGRR